MLMTKPFYLRLAKEINIAQLYTFIFIENRKSLLIA